MVKRRWQRSLSPQLTQFEGDSPQLKQASPPLYQTRQPRYTSQHTSGHRQVVRHQLPKLTLAGSSPVARSRKMHKHGSATLPCFLLPSAGTRTRQGASVKQTRSVCSEQAKAPEAGADLRSKYADVPLPAPSSGADFGKSGFNRRYRRFPGPGHADRSRRVFASQIRRRPHARSYATKC